MQISDIMNVITRTVRAKLGSNLGKDIVLTFIAQMVIMILALVVNKLLSNMLGVEGYGQYSIIKKSTAVLSFVMLSGMGIALPRYLSTYMTRKDYKSAKATVFSSVLVVLIVSFFVISICVWMKNEMGILLVGNHDKRLYFSAIFYAISITFSSLLFAYYRGTNSFILFSFSQITIQLIIAAAAVFYGHNLLLLLNIWAFTTLIYVLILIIVENKKKKFFKNNPITWNQNLVPQLTILFKYGLPRLVGDFFLFSFGAFPLIVISQKCGIASASFFAVGLMLVSIVTPFFSFSGMVLLPYVSGLIAENKFIQADKLINKLTILYIGLSIAAIIFLWFGIDMVINLFFSEEFLPSASISRILIITIISESIYLLLRNPIDAASHIPYNTFNLLISFVVLIILFSFSETIQQYAISFLLVSILKACLSFFSWQSCRNKLLK